MHDPEHAVATDVAVASLVVDYGDGVHKRFERVPCAPGTSVHDVLKRAQSLGPGLRFAFEPSFTDRGGQSRGHVTSVDGVRGESAWTVWINDEPAGDELSTRGQFSDHPGSPRVEAGDVVALRCERGPSAAP